MLVLARQRDQTVVIGDDIEVTVVDIRGDKVRLGINAPRTVSVHRKEVYDLIRKENESAAQVKPSDIPHVGGPSLAPIGKIEPAPLKPDEFMIAAIEEARKSQSQGGVPIGSVLVRDGKIIARGHNQRVQKNDPTAHAEIDCLTHAGPLKSYKDTILYSTLMPCYLCSGAVVQFGIPKVVVAESVNDTGGTEFMRRHQVEVVDLHNAECIDMLRKFIQENPGLWHEGGK